jgi:hypothetical protein
VPEKVRPHRRGARRLEMRKRGIVVAVFALVLTTGWYGAR